MNEYVWIGLGVAVFVVVLFGWRAAGKVFGSHENKAPKQSQG